MEFKFLINGELVPSSGGRTYPVYNKVDQSVLAEVPDSNPADIDAAVAAAKAARPGWRALAPVERGRLLLRLADRMDAAAAEIAPWFGPEEGLSKNALNHAMSFHSGLVRFYAGIADKQYGRVIQSERGPLNYTVREPLGVVACLLAWNTPLGSFTQKVTPALVAGNTVVVRVPDEAPLAVLAMGRLILDAGIPPGVINIVAGLGGETGAYLVSHPDVHGVSFTGSVSVGRAIAQAAAPTFKRSVLELGGKSPLLICADADLDRAARKAVMGAFAYQGQGCSAVSRVLVHEAVYPQVLERITRLVEAYQPGLPDDPPDGPWIGPLFNERQFKRTMEFVELARREGKLVTGGDRVESPPFAGGYFVRPALVKETDPSSRFFMEEIFGPVLTIISFEDEAQAIELANTCEYALSASVWSANSDAARRIAHALEFGTVWINDHLNFSHHSPWGGFKNTGWDREFGVDAVNSFTETKAIWLNS